MADVHKAAGQADAAAKRQATADAKRARQDAAAAKRADKKSGEAANKKSGGKEGYENGEDTATILAGTSAEMTAEQKRVAGFRAVTGVLASAPAETDIKFDSFSLAVGGNQLVNDCGMQLNQGCRYGLIGDNGCGKSNVLAAIAQREVPLPSHIDVFHLHEEAQATEETAVEAVINHVVKETEWLEALTVKIIEESGPEDDRLCAISDRLSELDPVGAEPRARKILFGLGFADHLVPMDRKTKHMSGGWRMRVSLAKALFAAPSLLLLDEPTNHLDLEACVWLEDHLANYSKCLFVISHSQDFLNRVCTHTVWLTRMQLNYYGGNYDSFVNVIAAEERIHAKVYEKQQADMEKLTTFVRVNRANGVAQSAKSKKKVLETLQDEAVEKPKERKQTLRFEFPECTRVEPPVLPFDNVSFSYSGKQEDYLYKNLDLAVDCDSRIALVGPNGCGKSTLIKLMSGELGPTEGQISKHQHCTMGLYHQHSAEVLENDCTPLTFMKKLFPKRNTEEVWVSYLKEFGFSGKQMSTEIGMLSDGQKSRLIFSMLAMKNYSILLLDEPTNHLDVDAVDGLAAAIKNFQGGVVLVSHDFRLIDQVAKEIWVCEKKTVTKWDGSIHEYRKKLSAKMAKHKV